MDIGILRTEIIDDPLGRSYSTMNAEEVSVSMNDIIDRTTNKVSLTGSEVLNAIDKAEFNAKTDAQKQQIWDIVHLGTINPFGIEKDLIQDIFGASITITNLAALRINNVSRGVELGIGHVWPGNVETARL